MQFSKRMLDKISSLHEKKQRKRNKPQYIMLTQRASKSQLGNS